MSESSTNKVEKEKVVKILVKDEHDRCLKIPYKKAAWMMDIFRASANESQFSIKGITTLVAKSGVIKESKQYIPVALDMPVIVDRLGDALLGHKDADLTDVTGSGVNNRIKQQLNLR